MLSKNKTKTCDGDDDSDCDDWAPIYPPPPEGTRPSAEQEV